MYFLERIVFSISSSAFLFAFLACANSAAAQGFERPGLGVVFDAASGDLRPIIGIPGSASLGTRLELEGRLNTAQVCSARGYALAVAQTSGSVEVIRYDKGGAPAITPLSVPASPDLLVLSPSCTSAALVYHAGAQAELISGLPEEPHVETVTFTGLNSTPVIAAIDDTGTSLLVATRQEREAVVERLGATLSNPAFVMSTASVSAISFLAKSSDALVADGTNGQLFLVHNAGSDHAASDHPYSTLIANRTEGIHDATSVSVSSGNGKAVVINPMAQSVAVIDLTRQTGVEIPCRCHLADAAPLRGGSLFRLGSQIAHPIALLETADESAKITLLPAEKPPTRK